MGYRFCDKTATAPAIHKIPRLSNSIATLEEDLYLCLSSEVDFEHDFFECALELPDFDILELSYPDDVEDDNSDTPTKNTGRPAELPTPPMHGSPPYSSASRAVQEAPHHDLFTNTTALTEALYARFQAFHSRAHHAHAHAQGPLFEFRGACDPLGFDRHDRRASARDVADAARAEIAARCALLFHAALPAAMIPAGVLVRSVCHVRRRPSRASDGSVRSFLGILDVSVVEADEKGRYTILVGFRVLG